MTIGYAPGVYDLFHVGHLNILRHSKSQCDHLIAGVVSDELAMSMKGRAPVVPLQERVAIVEALRVVDQVVVEDNLNKVDTWRSVPFDVIFKGDDWKGTPKGDALEAAFAAVGVQVVYLPYTMRTSSSLLRRTLESALEAQRPA